MYGSYSRGSRHFDSFGPSVLVRTLSSFLTLLPRTRASGRAEVALLAQAGALGVNEAVAHSTLATAPLAVEPSRRARQTLLVVDIPRVPPGLALGRTACGDGRIQHGVLRHSGAKAPHSVWKVQRRKVGVSPVVILPVAVVQPGVLVTILIERRAVV